MALLKQQLAEAQSVEKEREKLADKVDRFERRVRSGPSLSAGAPEELTVNYRWRR